MRIVWRGPLTDPSGFASQGRAFVRGLAECDADLRVEHLVWHWREAVTPLERERLADLIGAPVVPADAHIQHTLARLFDPYASGAVRVGRTAWEVDRVPADWAARAAQMDELWVPCAHNAEAFARSGVERDRLWVLPEPLELDRFRPGAAPPLRIPEAHGTVFLASLDWTLRKGWDVLIDAWLAAFAPDDDVTLVVKAWSSRGLTTADIQDRLVAHIRASGGDPGRMADVVILDQLLDGRSGVRRVRRSQPRRGVLPAGGRGHGGRPAGDRHRALRARRLRGRLRGVAAALDRGPGGGGRTRGGPIPGRRPLGRAGPRRAGGRPAGGTRRRRRPHRAR